MNRPPKLHERVRIVSGHYAGHEATVVRMLHRRDPESWCELGPTPDGAPPPHFPFPPDDAHGRGRHALVEWEDLAELEAPRVP